MFRREQTFTEPELPQFMNSCYLVISFNLFVRKGYFYAHQSVVLTLSTAFSLVTEGAVISLEAVDIFHVVPGTSPIQSCLCAAPTSLSLVTIFMGIFLSLLVWHRIMMYLF